MCNRCESKPDRVGEHVTSTHCMHSQALGSQNRLGLFIDPSNILIAPLCIRLKEGQLS